MYVCLHSFAAVRIFVWGFAFFLMLTETSIHLAVYWEVSLSLVVTLSSPVDHIDNSFANSHQHSSIKP